MSGRCILNATELLALALWGALAFGQSSDPKNGTSNQGTTAAQVQIPARPAAALFQGEQGNQRAEIHYDRNSGLVTVKMLVQDPNGYFIPNIRRENFVVYENGVRQEDAAVEMEHAPVTLGVMMEFGGRYQALNQALGEEVPRAAHQLVEKVGRQDKIAAWKYGDRLEQLTDFTKSPETLDGVILTLRPPEFSEANFYDALIAALRQMKTVAGRKALVLISSGVDTFSKARYRDVLDAVRECGTPIYAIDAGPILREAMERYTHSGPYARIDWNRAETELREIAATSGGRLYTSGAPFDLSGIYDDMMENLRVRYVITYKSSSTGDPGAARTVRVELVNPSTGGPLEIVDSDGKPVRTKLFVQESYAPATAPDE